MSSFKSNKKVTERTTKNSKGEKKKRLQVSLASQVPWRLGRWTDYCNKKKVRLSESGGGLRHLLNLFNTDQRVDNAKCRRFLGSLPQDSLSSHNLVKEITETHL